MDDKKTTIGRYIKKLRKAKMLTQQGFADRLCVKRSYISELENGKKKPSVRLISSICREFRVNIEWLKHGTGEMYDYAPLPSDQDNPMTAAVFKDRFKAALAVLGLNKQKDVVARVGFSKEYVRELLSGKSMPDTFVLQIIGSKLGISSTWLRYGEAPMFLEKPVEMPPMSIRTDIVTGETIPYKKSPPPTLLCQKETEYINKLLTILQTKDEETIRTITQNIDTCLKVPDKPDASLNTTDKQAKDYNASEGNMPYKNNKQSVFEAAEETVPYGNKKGKRC